MLNTPWVDLHRKIPSDTFHSVGKTQATQNYLLHSVVIICINIIKLVEQKISIEIDLYR